MAVRDRDASADRLTLAPRERRKGDAKPSRIGLRRKRINCEASKVKLLRKSCAVQRLAALNH